MTMKRVMALVLVLLMAMPIALAENRSELTYDETARLLQQLLAEDDGEQVYSEMILFLQEKLNKKTYENGMKQAQEGNYAEAYKTFSTLAVENYSDSAEKAYVLGVTEFATVADKGNGVAAFQFHDNWGLINVNANLITTPTWSEVGEVNQLGLLWAEINEKGGFINAQGETVVDCQWDKGGVFGKELLWVNKGRQYGLFSAQGNMITPCKWDIIEGLSTQLIRVSSKGKQGLIDMQGETVLDCVWDSVDIYAADLYEVTKKEKNVLLYGLADGKGNIITPAQWLMLNDVREDRILVQNKEGLMGYIDPQGNEIVQPTYNEAFDFSEGLAAVKTGDMWQFIDQNGAVVIPARYSEVTSFQNGRAEVKLPGVGWQIIDKNGQLVYFVTQNVKEEYERGVELFEAGEYLQAEELFKTIFYYKDVETYLNKCDDHRDEINYQAAKLLVDAARYEEAIAAFEALNGYSDSAAQIEACNEAIRQREYQAAVALSESGQYEKAIPAFEALNGYADSVDRIKACEEMARQRDYEKAKSLMEARKYAGAYALFLTIQGYRDVDQILATDTNLLSEAKRAQYRKSGGYITFGHYEQDNNTANGKEPLEWILIDEDVENHRVLLMSRYVLDAQRFHGSKTNPGWKESAIRSWLNEEFVNTAFSDIEKAAIIEVEVQTENGKAADKVWMLSKEEVEKYLSDENLRKALPTAYAMANGAATSSGAQLDGHACCWWWLRSAGNNKNRASCVKADGMIGSNSVNDSHGGIRPVIWVKDTVLEGNLK